MSLSIKEVEDIAELARMDLTDAEKQTYAQQLSAILDYVAALQALNTDDIPPTASVLPLATVTRADEAKPGADRDDLLANTRDREAGMFKVKAVLDGE